MNEFSPKNFKRLKKYQEEGKLKGKQEAAYEIMVHINMYKSRLGWEKLIEYISRKYNVKL